MKIPLDPESPSPLYAQLATGLIEAIGGGLLGGGALMPSSRVLAANNDVNYHTVARALAILEEEGLIERRRGERYRVVERAGEVARARLLDESLDALIRQSVALGVPGQALVRRLEQRLGKGGLS